MREENLSRGHGTAEGKPRRWSIGQSAEETPPTWFGEPERLRGQQRVQDEEEDFSEHFPIEVT